MTYDFVPHWLEKLELGLEKLELGLDKLELENLPACGQFSTAPFSAPTTSGAVSPLAPMTLPLRCLSSQEVAALVGELFAEGSLSWEQLRSLLAIPELQPHLRAAIRSLPGAGDLVTAGP